VAPAFFLDIFSAIFIALLGFLMSDNCDYWCICLTFGSIVDIVFTLVAIYLYCIT
jgi:hypothetical protein